jgi:hypothetical protein
MNAPGTPEEIRLAHALHARFVGVDLANRMPLHCNSLATIRAWCDVARLANALVLGLEPPDSAEMQALAAHRPTRPQAIPDG